MRELQMDNQVQITVVANDEGWRRRCNEIMERLKATQPRSDEDPPSQQVRRQQDLFWEKKCMDSELQEAVENGDADKFVEGLEKVCSEKKLLLSSIFDQVTLAGDSWLHLAASFGKSDIAILISDHFPELLAKTNIIGDTPLHAAARSNSADIIRVILSQYHTHRSTAPTNQINEEEEIITKLTNEYGNTALHDAVENKHVEGVRLLFEADNCAVHCLNKLGTSPLYLAVFNGSKEIVDIMLQAAFPDDIPKCHGNSPPHAAVHKKNTDLIYLRDKEGGTPLHYAATIGFVEGVHVLLKATVPTILEWNTKGHLPIHLACKWGHVKVVKELLNSKKWPRYSGAFLNQKGQNILHIAAKNGRDNVVNYILKSKNTDINAKDKDGNTPLHFATKYNFPSIVRSLTKDRKILLNVLSNEGTPRDTLWKHSEAPMTVRQWLTDVVLSKAGADFSFKTRNDNNRKGRVAEKQDGMKENTNTLMLVAVLIVTVTFHAAVTVPTYQKTEIDTFLFACFELLNSIALYFSTFGSVLLMWAQFGGDRLAKTSYNWALCMVFFALVSMTLAFLAAANLDSMDIFWLEPVRWIVGFIFYALMCNLCTLSFLVFKSHKSEPVPAKIPLSMKVLIWFYKNSQKEEDYKKLANSASSEQAAMHEQ